MTAAAEVERGFLSALGVLNQRGVVCYPTETVYGLGADIGTGAALDTLAELKGRGHGKPFSVLVADVEMAADLSDGALPREALRLAEAFWPGPLTIVVPARRGLHARLVGEGGGVGLRCSSDPTAVALVAAFAKPLTSTSANPSGTSPAETVAQARGYFATSVACYLDGGLRGSGSVSTVVAMASGRVRLLRAGAVTEAALARLVELEN